MLSVSSMVELCLSLLIYFYGSCIRSWSLLYFGAPYKRKLPSSFFLIILWVARVNVAPFHKGPVMVFVYVRFTEDGWREKSEKPAVKGGTEIIKALGEGVVSKGYGAVIVARCCQ